MPNWVYNYITVQGDEDNIAMFLQHISTEPEAVKGRRDSNQDYEGFSYHAFITPPSDNMEEYWESGWYNWNTENWGVKWDAGSVEVGTSSTDIGIRFDSPWGPPDLVLAAMAQQWPALTFNIWWEEEQGYGAELLGQNGSIQLVKEWSIPESHADHIDQDKEDSCRCSWADDPEDYYPDCPGYEDGNAKPTYLYEVKVSSIYKVKAKNEFAAELVVKAKENDQDFPEDTEFVSVEYDASYEVIVLETYEPKGGE